MCCRGTSLRLRQGGEGTSGRQRGAAVIEFAGAATEMLDSPSPWVRKDLRIDEFFLGNRAPGKRHLPATLTAGPRAGLAIA